MATIMLHVDDTLDEEKVYMTFDELEVQNLLWKILLS